jgi:MFS transporter, DHA1 family, multidrug resistance protein
LTSFAVDNPDVAARALNALLVYIFFMAMGFTLVMPLVAVHFVDNLGMAAATVGLALGVRQLTQQGLAMFGGGLADRFGARRVVCAGVLLRAVGFAALALADELPLLFVAMLLIALGGSLFEPAYQSAIAALTTPQNRARYFSLGNTVSGVAYTAGPLLGVWLLRFDFALVCAAAAGCFLVTFAIATTLPRITTSSTPLAIRAGLQLVRNERAFLLLTLLLIGYWFTAVQLNISFALLATQLTGSTDSVGVVFALNAGMTAALQYPLIRWLERHFSTTRILVLGVIIMAIGAGAIALVPSFALFLVCIAVFSLGTLLARPTQQTLIVAMANPQAVGTFIGFSSLGLAVGGGLGNVAGGWLVDLADAWQWRPLPSLVFCAVAMSTALGIHLLTRHRTEPGVKLHGESTT